MGASVFGTIDVSDLVLTQNLQNEPHLSLKNSLKLLKIIKKE